MNTQTTSHKIIRITGRVQGVGFRWAARHAASLSGIHGFVKNLSNGDVYIEAEGNPDQVEEFISWCMQGPPRARIDHVDVTDGKVRGFEEFRIAD